MTDLEYFHLRAIADGRVVDTKNYQVIMAANPEPLGTDPTFLSAVLGSRISF